MKDKFSHDLLQSPSIFPYHVVNLNKWTNWLILLERFLLRRFYTISLQREENRLPNALSISRAFESWDRMWTKCAEFLSADAQVNVWRRQGSHDSGRVVVSSGPVRDLWRAGLHPTWISSLPKVVGFTALRRTFRKQTQEGTHSSPEGQGHDLVFPSTGLALRDSNT